MAALSNRGNKRINYMFRFDFWLNNKAAVADRPVCFFVKRMRVPVSPKIYSLFLKF